MKGRIIHFNPEKGFGFILGMDNEKYFFHISNVVNPMKLDVGYNVEFTPNNNKGLSAVNIIVEAPVRIKDKWLKIDNIRIKASEIKEYELYEQHDDTNNKDCFVLKITTYSSGVKKLFFCIDDYDTYYKNYYYDDHDDYYNHDYDNMKKNAYRWLEYIDEELDKL